MILNNCKHCKFFFLNINIIFPVHGSVRFILQRILSQSSIFNGYEYVIVE